jgi:thimet oligopeptidase
MPDSYIARLDKAADGRYKVTVSYPDFYPFMQNSTNVAARRELEKKFSNRASDKNLALLKQALDLRQQLATTMGYKTFADYATVDRMAKNPKNVMEFLNGLVAKLKPYRDADLATLTTLKQQSEGRTPARSRSPTGATTTTSSRRRSTRSTRRRCASTSRSRS